MTEKVAHELTRIDAHVAKDSSFHLRGMTITAKKAQWDRIILSVDVDPRLNLWRGRPNDLASSHLGSLELIVTSITDENGNNIHDTSHDKPWGNKIIIYNRGHGVFTGSRYASYKGSGSVKAKRVAGSIRLSLPVNLKKYVVSANVPESVMPLVERDDISNVELKHGIFIQHPGPTPGFRLTIMGFNSAGKRLSIESMGSGGSSQTNHWYYFGNGVAFDKMVIFIPGGFVHLEIPFSIDMQ